MAEASMSVNHDQFICSVCLDLLKNPVTLPCGHSYCMVCINQYWDRKDNNRVYSCPECRDTFTPRPVLCRNIMLAEVVEKLKKKTEVQAASPAHCYAGPGDVECDFCTGRKHKAVKSCLTCLASFCETHLKPHYEVPGLKKHSLVTASGKICPEHDEVLEMYCRIHRCFICYMYFCDLTLDPNTVNYYLILSEMNRAVTCSKRARKYSDHPERFDYYVQVLSKESVCGRCYWEVEWSSEECVYIAVSYKDISRKGWGNESRLGGNNRSWSLRCSPSLLSFYHNNVRTDLGAPSSSRIGVYVDHSAGTLSFYSVSDTMELLHRVHTTYAQPLYAGFWLRYRSTVRFLDI
ncbi:E3 ubiquitin/ISG15 ligase TRIM25-like [Clarias gariepinus]|uniref:E3 ubiquitin/ISG15 ligase TRIM25-like n=1 Tax=Clarias gariepinus TaxID=13013 RepID=UPI00234E0BA3|nr:E3 ubiquitin/ISG15 ligase TRIM25-like [Clarias gariepinus]